jgi:GTP diphosphokinase / guanosine-3',5'-bis(diphosphate) 3'-diphosphatase
MLDAAIAIAAEAHKGQVDKSGRPYILHPLRVMDSVQSDDEKIVAVLHDVVEDSDWTLLALQEAGFPSHIVWAIDALTKKQGEDYRNFTERVSQNTIATVVKIADLRDNMDITRLPLPLTEKDHARLDKYARALRYLGG